MVNQQIPKIILIFATHNQHKVQEIQTFFKPYPIHIKQQAWKTYEVQSDNLQEIARLSVIDAVKKSQSPTFVEDTGFYIDALRGFPGPYASYVHKTIGNSGILKLMLNSLNRKAYFRSVIAYCTPDTPPVCFEGIIQGTLALNERGPKGFGFDPIFIPSTDCGKTFGEMVVSEKNPISHRGRALKKFINWLLESSLYIEENDGIATCN
jgi:XTP/dITP diphosphohydrolase